MRCRHFEAIRPVCPVCRAEGRTDQFLVIAKAMRQTDQEILEGILHCPNVNCRREYPILDGIPIIVGPLRQYVSENVIPALMRSDLSHEMESLLGDCSGPGSAFDTRRQLLSAYMWNHYAEFDVTSSTESSIPGSIVRVLNHSLTLAGTLPNGMVIDMGCSVGRTSFELARRTEDCVLGVDLNFSMLQMASQVLKSKLVQYPSRRVGVVYDRREFEHPYSELPNVDFWACDLLALPFAAQTFSTAVALNVLDCVSSPIEFLKSACGLLQPKGKLILTTPFDWSTAATAVEAWLGGHSQRAIEGGDSATHIRRIFAEQIPEMALREERSSIPWQVKLHERAIMSYDVDLFIAETK